MHPHTKSGTRKSPIKRAVLAGRARRAEFIGGDSEGGSSSWAEYPTPFRHRVRLPAGQPDFGYFSGVSEWRTDPFPHLIGDGIACFRDPVDAHLPRPVGPVPSEFRTRPHFGATGESAASGPARLVRIAIGRGTSLYGTGEV